jgi:hypothetical protein
VNVATNEEESEVKQTIVIYTPTFDSNPSTDFYFRK